MRAGTRSWPAGGAGRRRARRESGRWSGDGAPRGRAASSRGVRGEASVWGRGRRSRSRLRGAGASAGRSEGGNRAEVVSTPAVRAQPRVAPRAVGDSGARPGVFSNEDAHVAGTAAGMKDENHEATGDGEGQRSDHGAEGGEKRGEEDAEEGRPSERMGVDEDHQEHPEDPGGPPGQLQEELELPPVLRPDLVDEVVRELVLVIEPSGVRASRRLGLAVAVRPPARERRGPSVSGVRFPSARRDGMGGRQDLSGRVPAPRPEGPPRRARRSCRSADRAG